MAVSNREDISFRVTPVRTLDEVVYKARIDGALSEGKPNLKMIDLYAGAGGLTLGFSRKFGHRFVSVWANDICPHAVRTYNANFGGHCVAGDIRQFLADPETEIPQADIVIGGPPCQGFSLLNIHLDKFDHSSGLERLGRKLAAKLGRHPRNPGK